MTELHPLHLCKQHAFAIQTEKKKKTKNQCVTFATVELKAIALNVLDNLKSDPETAAIASEVIQTHIDTNKPESVFNTRLTQITLIKNRQVHDYLKVCLIRLQTTEETHGQSTSQTRAEDQLCILKALLSA
jgi:hypothetical protein